MKYSMFLVIILLWLPACKTSAPVKKNPGSEPIPVSDKGKWDLNQLNTATDAGYLSDEEKDVILEINKFRSNPALYAELYLKPYRQYYNGNKIEVPGKITILTHEGVKALNEAISALGKSKPVPLLYPVKGMSKAAADHVKDQGKTGQLGHTGSDGSGMTDRLNRYGKWISTIGENIDYGHNNGREIVMALLIDDGVPSRGHRKNLLNDAFHKIGVSIGPHPKFDYVCVMDFAGDYQ
jgi:uncharacterized protein YkwD